MKIAVIGTGNVGGTLGTRWAKGDHSVVFGARDPANPKVRSLLKLSNNKAKAASVADAAAGADVVVLATPWNATREAVKNAGNLGGKIVVDCTNPIAEGLKGLSIGTDTSAAEQVALWARGARVVKAFNTTGFNVMANPKFDGAAATMFICGDDAEARRVVGNLAEELGFDVCDAGVLSSARYLEPLAMLWIHLAYAQGWGREFAFTLLKR